MRRAMLAASLILLTQSARSQTTPDDTLSGPPPKSGDVLSGPSVPGNGAPGDKTTDMPADEPPPKPLPTPTPAPPVASWQPHTVALLQALDKVDGQSSTLSIPVGSKQIYRNISIDVRACFARPPDQSQDATAYLIIQDSSISTPSFVGWMLAAEPASSLMEHPVYDVRVLGCR